MPADRLPAFRAPSPPVGSSFSLRADRGTPLPVPLTPLIARDRELAAVVALLRDPGVRLLNLTGPGGVGKTRLAVAAATDVGDAFPDGVAFIHLAPIADPDLVLAAIASALGLRDMGSMSLHERLFDLMAGDRLLLVLDNFERVVAAGPRLLDLLGACPGLTILVTSRLRLRLSGEREFPVSPLPLGAATTGEDVGKSGAVRLFAERAQAVRPDFRLDAGTLPAVAEIVGRVDGLPLAIELAAARVNALPPAELLRRMGQRLPLLSGGVRDLPLRQQTMRDTIGWSYDLLAPAEQDFFRRLAAFSGGFTLAAAAAVAAPPAGDGSATSSELAALEWITSLIEQSVVHLGPAGAEPRYAMLETVREYARDRLDASGEGDAVRRRHAAFFLAFAEAAERQLIGPHQAADWLGRLAADHDNLRAALDWLAHAGEPEAFLRLCRALWVFWLFRGPYAEGRVWLERALARGGEAGPRARREALYGLGLLAVNQDDVARAESCFGEGLAIAEAHRDPAGVSYGWFGLGLVAMHRRRFDQAVAHLEEALAEARRVEDRALAAVRAGLALSFIGASAYARGELPLAAARFEAALAEQRAVDHRWGMGFSLVGMGYAARERGETARALSWFADGLTLFTELDDRRMIALALDGVAGSGIAGGESERAVRLFGAAAAMRGADGLPVEPAFSAAHERGLAAARAALGEDAFAAHWNAGAALPPSAAVAEAAAIARPVPGPTAASPAPRLAERLGLTPREIEVLRLLAEGLSDREIAAALSISERTAGNHVQHAMQKFGVDSRTAAAVVAVRHGLS